MKEFTTLTDLQLLNYACDRLLDIYLKEKGIYERHQSELNKIRYQKSKAKYEEVRNEILRLEKLQNNE